MARSKPRKRTHKRKSTRRKQLSAAAAAMGRVGGRVKSAAKAAAVRENGKLGGRPRKDGKPPQRRANADRASSSEQGLTRDTRQVNAENLDRASSSKVAGRRLIGWTVGDGSGTEGYTVESYFDADGKYKGPDEHGIEPIFDGEDDSQSADRASSSEPESQLDQPVVPHADQD